VFTEVTFDGPTSSPRLVVPRAAVQAIGARNVVYVATDDEGRFLDTVEVLDGVKAGERVVSEGSFFLRAEAGRARSSG
jgi:multidrug efflux pump subunit AcrA (membrane-fusion protein)